MELNDRKWELDIKYRIYRTQFTPTPVGNIRQQTENPYIIIEKLTDAIHDDTEGFTIYDLAYFDGNVYVATNYGVYMFGDETQKWFRLKYNTTIYKFVTDAEHIYAFGGKFLDEMFSTDYDEGRIEE